MQFKLFSIDIFGMAYEKLMLENAPGARVCCKTNTGTSRCTRTTRNILLNTGNGMYMTINAV